MCLIVCMYGVEGMYGVQGVHMGRKLAMRESVDRRADEQPKNNTSGMPNAQQKGNKDTKSPHESCRSDFFFIFHGNRSRGVVMCGQRTKVKTAHFPGHKVLLVREIF